MIDFSAGWYILFAFAVVLFAAFSYLRKSFAGCMKFGFIGLAAAVVSEAIGVGTGLWNYTGGNWPVILWVNYFLFAATFYQIFCVINKKS